MDKYFDVIITVIVIVTVIARCLLTLLEPEAHLNFLQGSRVPCLSPASKHATLLSHFPFYLLQQPLVTCCHKSRMATTQVT